MFANEERVKLLLYLFSVKDPAGQILFEMSLEKHTNKITDEEAAVYNKALLSEFIRWLVQPK